MYLVMIWVVKSVNWLKKLQIEWCDLFIKTCENFYSVTLLAQIIVIFFHKLFEWRWRTNWIDLFIKIFVKRGIQYSHKVALLIYKWYLFFCKYSYFLDIFKVKLHLFHSKSMDFHQNFTKIARLRWFWSHLWF